MKILSFLFFVFVWVSPVFGQTLSQAVIKDFSTNFYFKQRIEKNENLSAIASLAGQRLGYGLVDIEIATEQLEKNVKFREEVFKTICQLYKSDHELLSLNLMSIGMTASNAKVLAKYILSKYKGAWLTGNEPNTNQTSGDQHLFDDVESKDSSQQSLKPKEVLNADSSSKQNKTIPKSNKPKAKMPKQNDE